MLEHHGHALGRAGDRFAMHDELAAADRSVRPAMQRSSVVLPQPLGPTMQRISWWRTARTELAKGDDGAVEKDLARIFRDDCGATGGLGQVCSSRAILGQSRCLQATVSRRIEPAGEHASESDKESAWPRPPDLFPAATRFYWAR